MSRNSDDGIKFIGLVICVALIFGILIADNIRTESIKHRCTATTTGVVTAYDVMVHSRARHSYNQSYTYTTEAVFEVNGVPYTAKGQGKALFVTGEDIEIHYDPDKPSVAYSGPYPRSYAYIYMWVAIGVVVVVVGSLIFKKASKSRYPDYMLK